MAIFVRGLTLNKHRTAGDPCVCLAASAGGYVPNAFWPCSRAAERFYCPLPPVGRCGFLRTSKWARSLSRWALPPGGTLFGQTFPAGRGLGAAKRRPKRKGEGAGVPLLPASRFLVAGALSPAAEASRRESGAFWTGPFFRPFPPVPRSRVVAAAFFTHVDSRRRGPDRPEAA